MGITGLLNLDLQIGDLKRSVTFAIVDNLAVPLIVGTAYQDKFSEAILGKAHRLKPIDSRAIPIIGSFDSSVCTLESADDARPMKVQVCSNKSYFTDVQGYL